MRTYKWDLDVLTLPKWKRWWFCHNSYLAICPAIPPLKLCIWKCCLHHSICSYPLLQQSLKGVCWFHHVCLWVEPCPLCIFINTHWIYFIFTHPINQLQKECHSLFFFIQNLYFCWMFLFQFVGPTTWPWPMIYGDLCLWPHTLSWP